MQWEIRELQGADLNTAYFALLRELTTAPDLNSERAIETLDQMHAQGTRTFVAVVDGIIIGTCSLVLEHKLARGGCLSAHIEDVISASPWRGRGVGKSLVQHAIAQARGAGAYKVILDCSDENIPFYAKLGFTRRDNFMRLDL